MMTAVFILLLSTIVLWSIQAYRQSEAVIGTLVLQGIILLLVLVFMVPFMKSARDNIRLGLPMEDERSKGIKVLAGYYAFMVSLYLWLGIMMFDEYFTVDSAVAAAILGSAVTFGLAYVFLGRNSKVE